MMNILHITNILQIFIYLYSIFIYLYPISSQVSYITSPIPILDEIHILTKTNSDVHRQPQQYPISSITTTAATKATNHNNNNNIINFIKEEIQIIYNHILQNDYWNRKMNHLSSHKSYRPFTVLTFRYVNILYHRLWKNKNKNTTTNNGNDKEEHQKLLILSMLYIQRFVNISIHSTIILLLSYCIPTMIQLPLLLLHHDKNKSMMMMTMITILTQIFFTLHPSHSEFVVNIANRNHLLSILFGVLCCCCGGDGSLWKVGTIYTMGLLSSETFLFILPIIICTWIWIVLSKIILLSLDVNNNDNGDDHDNDDDIDIQTTHGNTNNKNEESITTSITTIKVQPIIKQTIYILVPQILLIISLSILYLSIRYYNDWLSIPNDLIRRAENPFIALLQQQQQQYGDNDDNGNKRIRYHINYIYILCIHIIKSLGMGLIDCIGLSHEYGYNCIKELEMRITPLRQGQEGIWNVISSFIWIDDERVWIIVGVIVFFIFTLIQCCTLLATGDENEDRSQHVNQHHMNIKMSKNDKMVLGFMFWIVFCLWIFASLFPVSGFVKVGTFVADRLVGPSTVITSLFWGWLFTIWIMSPLMKEKSLSYSSSLSWNQMIQFGYRCMVLVTIFIVLSIKVYRRNQEWMTPKSLLESSLRVCPQSAKSHLEYSKIYSGLFSPQIYDLKKALHHVQMAEEIDVEYCDVHYQFGYIYFQQKKYLKFEESITKGILCPFTMDGSYALFQKYWKVMLDGSSNNHELGGENARRRYEKYAYIIQDAIEKEKAKDSTIGVGAATTIKDEL